MKDPKKPKARKRSERTADQWIDAMLGSDPKSRRFRTFLIFLALALAIFFASNAGYFTKRLRHAIAPVERQEVPEKAIDDAILLGLAGNPDRLRIPNLDIESPIVYVEERKEAAYQKALRDGVAHFPGTAAPGRPGNVYLFGHSSDFPLSPGDYKTIFAALPDIRVGDAIYLTDPDGNAFRYLATGMRIVAPDDLSVLEQGEKPKRMLTLQTSYPIGTALRRFIVTAEFDAELLK